MILKDDISKPLKYFLDYIDGKEPADELMQEIDKEVDTVKCCDEWRREYMTLAFEMDRKYAEGKTDGVLNNALASVRNLIAKTDMSPQEAINLLGYDKALSDKLMPLLK